MKDKSDLVTKQYLGVLKFKGNLRVVLGVVLRILVRQKWQKRILVVVMKVWGSLVDCPSEEELMSALRSLKLLVHHGQCLLTMCSFSHMVSFSPIFNKYIQGK